jgi:hypothetical protein
MHQINYVFMKPPARPSNSDLRISTPDFPISYPQPRMSSRNLIISTSVLRNTSIKATKCEDPWHSTVHFKLIGVKDVLPGLNRSQECIRTKYGFNLVISDVIIN